MHRRFQERNVSAQQKIIVEGHTYGIKLLHKIFKKVKPIKKISGLNLKSTHERADRLIFDLEVSKLLRFFIKTRKEIKIDTGNKVYDKYVCLFYFSALKDTLSNLFNLLVTTTKKLQKRSCGDTENMGAVIRKYNYQMVTGE